MKKVCLLDLTYDELSSLIEEIDEKPFRAKQVFQWIHKGIESFDEMSNIPAETRKKLSEISTIGQIKILERLHSKLDDTTKYLFLLEDDNIIEGVLMRYTYGNTLCISSQVGCKMGCRFCASTLNGLVRDLHPGEMVGQVLAVNNDLCSNGRKRSVTNVVIMGSGEPLDNYENTVKFLRSISHPEGFHMSLRNISLSTCGLVPQILALADENLPITLSVSLHAPDDDTRQKIMPIAKAYKIRDILDACRVYIKRTGRRVIFEYALISGINDSLKQAKMLADILRGIQCHVNLIPLNPVAEREYITSYKNDIHRFRKQLERMHISVTQRRELGSDINGACGQLRRKYLKAHGKI